MAKNRRRRLWMAPNDSVQQGLTVIENQTAKAKLFFETQTLNWKWKN